MKRIALLFSLIAVLAACTAQTTRYPSLGKRAAEGQGFAEPEAPAPAPVVADPALDTKIAKANAMLAAATSRFAAAATRTGALARAASGAAAGSDAWLDAQTSLAELDAIRADTSAALTDLETLALDRAQALRSAYPTLDTAITAAQSAVLTQSDRIATIQAMLAAA